MRRTCWRDIISDSGRWERLLIGTWPTTTSPFSPLHPPGCLGSGLCYRRAHEEPAQRQGRHRAFRHARAVNDRFRLHSSAGYQPDAADPELERPALFPAFQKNLLDFFDFEGLGKNSQNRIESYHQLRSAIAQVGGKKELTGRTDIEIEISNQCARLIANAIIYYNSGILSRLVAK
jgi:hypothetical protein